MSVKTGKRPLFFLFFKFFLGIILFFIFGVTCIFLLGGDYGIELPRGYEISRIYAQAVVLSDAESSIVILPNIDGYNVYDHFIVGHVSLSPTFIPVQAADSKPGFFIVDMRNNEVQQGLDEKQWISYLKKYGVTEKPELKKPSSIRGVPYRIKRIVSELRGHRGK